MLPVPSCKSCTSWHPLGNNCWTQEAKGDPGGSLGHLGDGPSAERGLGKNLHPDRRKRVVQVGPHPVCIQKREPVGGPGNLLLFHPLKVTVANTSEFKLSSASAPPIQPGEKRQLAELMEAKDTKSPEPAQYSWTGQHQASICQSC